MIRIKISNKRRFYISLSLILSVVLCISTIFIVKVSARQQTKYKTVYVEYNDSLWSISSKVVTSKVDIRDYIEEVKGINKLKNSDIYPGQKLLLPILE